MLKGFIKKADIVLFIVLVVIGLASTAYVLMSRSSGETVVVKYDGELYGKYSLLEDRKIKIEEGEFTNTIVIKDGHVKVTESNCTNQVCVRHSEISSAGESIVCLPHKLVVSIEGKGDSKYDSISS